MSSQDFKNKRETLKSSYRSNFILKNKNRQKDRNNYFDFEFHHLHCGIMTFCIDQLKPCNILFEGTSFQSRHSFF